MALATHTILSVNNASLKRSRKKELCLSIVDRVWPSKHETTGAQA
jgi:hypothetical protein